MTSYGQWTHWAQNMVGERPSDDPKKLEIWGYSGQPSYEPGETLELHVSTTAATYAVQIYRDGAEFELVYEQDGLPGSRHETPDDAYISGCGWPVSHTVEIPEEWRSGGYVVVLKAADERGEVVQDGFFVLRAPSTAPRKGICFVLATYTWQEYNDWGGGCGYSSPGHPDQTLLDDSRGPEAFTPRLSYQRPWARGLIRVPRGTPRKTHREPPEHNWAPRYKMFEWAASNGYSIFCGSAGWANYDGYFARWAERQGYEVEYLSLWDLDRDASALDGYDVVVTVGHDEYWSGKARATLDRYIEEGGHYARFAGNIMWQVRIEDDGVTQVCHKWAPDADPLKDDPDPSRRTGFFEHRNIDQPPVKTFGTTGSYGMYSRMGAASPRGVGGFIVYRNDHWAFAGTDLYYADVFGSAVPLVAYELDGVAYTFDNGLPKPTGVDGAPPELEILALTPGTLSEEDHGHPGAFLSIGDADVGAYAEQALGEDTPENRDRLRRGCATINCMPKGKGECFTAGTVEWPYALDHGEPVAEQITRNVLNRYGGGK